MVSTYNQCVIIYLVIILHYGVSFGSLNDQSTIPEDSYLNFTQLARKYVHAAIEHQVTTEDGYILSVFNIPGDRTRPVLLMHGIIDTADTFIIRGYASLAVTLAALGYDVWFGNARGTKYSRRHVSLNPDLDKSFWDFSFHEMGMYDLPATIDYILGETGRARLSAVAHSQGTTVFYVMGSLRPEYSDKVSVLVSLAPVSVVNNIKPPVSLLVLLSPLLGIVVEQTGGEELFSDLGLLKATVKGLCLPHRAYYEFCNSQLFLSAGADPSELEAEFAPVVFGHYPAGTSRKNALHTAQQGLGKNFAQYDYGSRGNLLRYGSMEPPEYNLRNVTMKVALLVGRNDKIATVEDAITLRNILPNVVMFHVIKRKKCNHMDFVWGKHMNKYLFPVVLKLLSEYS